MTIIKLAPKPPASKEIRDNILDILKEYQKHAEEGKLECLVIIGGFVDNSWTNHMSGTLDFPQAIGKLQIAMQEWIAEELTKED